MSTNFQFYLKNRAGTLVPARLLDGPDGQPIENTIVISGPYSPNVALVYYSIAGLPESASVANPNNYVVVPATFDINTVIKFAGYVEALYNVGGLAAAAQLMVGGFVGEGAHGHSFAEREAG